MRWDLFCHVVDNFGDVGICWRLARRLAEEHGAQVRLWVDNLQSFACLCPTLSTKAAVQQLGAIEVRHWPTDFADVEIPDVVIEAFACELPESYVARMAQRTVAPVWINLEYLSAEDWVDGCHLLPSPHPRWPLTKYFFFPGFTPKTGGLIRERNLLDDRARFDAEAEAAFWRALGIPARTGDEIRVSLFCYDNPALPDLLNGWADSPPAVRLLACDGQATRLIADWFGEEFSPGSSARKGNLTVHALPFLSHASYDRLLWACDVNFVRGEDSFVRAQWAQRPFVWQIYPQAEGAHLVKLEAFLTRFLSGFAASDVVSRLWRAWNGDGEIGACWREFVASRELIEEHGRVWADHLDRISDLAENLTRFVREK